MPAPDGVGRFVIRATRERGVGVPSSRSLATASREATLSYEGRARAPNLPNAVLASMATTGSSSRTCAKLDRAQAATVVLPIRVGRVVVMDHNPVRR